jgi:hypothetical protein
MPFLALSTCHGCGKIFCFNPDLVPMVQYADGFQGEICQPCLERSNIELEKQGLPLLYFPPGAYSPGE